MRSGLRQSIDAKVRRLFIFGAGGSGRETAWLAEQCAVSELELTFLVDQANYLSPPVNGVKVSLLSDVRAHEHDRFVVALGDSALRRKAATACELAGLRATALVHPRAEMSSLVAVGKGSVVCAGTVLTTGVILGDHVQINVSCSISHDVRIGDFATLSPGVHVAGNVDIGRSVFVGAGATIINGQKGAPLIIGEGAVIAAGACVTGSVEAGALMAGVPAVRKR